MYKKILILTTLLCLIGFATACENKITNANDYVKKDDDTLQSSESLVGTKWKLVGFFDVETDTLKVSKPKEGFDSTTGLTFVEPNTLGFTDTEYQGNTTSNGVGGNFIANYALATIQFIPFYSTYLTEFYDGELYGRIIALEFINAQPFEFNDSVLKLYYNNQKNYLLFERRQ